MRSGQYKVNGGSSKTLSGTSSIPGQFRGNLEHEDPPPPSSSPTHPDASSLGDFPHLNSLVIAMNKMADKGDGSGVGVGVGAAKLLLRGNSTTRLRGLNKSCENLYSERRLRESRVSRVEQKVKSFLMRGDSRAKASLSSPTRGEGASSEVAAPYEWQYGHVVTLPRRPKLGLSFSHTTLSTLPASDTMSCLSASSGYSSSSSSSYSSFKSSSSNCSTLPRKKTSSESSNGSSRDSPPVTSRVSTVVDNPMYDVSPGTSSSSPSSSIPPTMPTPMSVAPALENPLYDMTPNSNQRLLMPQAGTLGSNSMDSLQPDSLELVSPSPSSSSSTSSTAAAILSESISEIIKFEGVDEEEEEAKEDTEDLVAERCREYFERRLKNSETLKKRWSVCSSDSGADSGDSDGVPSLLGHADTMVEPSSIVSSTLATFTTTTTTTAITTTAATATSSSSSGPLKKMPLDEKMEFLRKEIASLMNQDNALFKQLLTLHDSIKTLKSQPPHHRPSSPNSFDSFTEEEEEEDEDDEEEDDEEHDDEERRDHSARREQNMLVPSPHAAQTMRAHVGLSDEDEGLETDRSRSQSTSPFSTLSNKSSLESTPHSSKARARSIGSACIPPSFHHSEFGVHPYCSSRLSLAENCGSLGGRCDGTHRGAESIDSSCSFTRARRSYAPTARNRRRSSSAHLTLRPPGPSHATYREALIM
ncbi:uncharacterized protein LOC143029609 [Oratosquilla oratoria]|uniref:uncharacterized protein LOC143029609 n=1 Tax=Oratosquilla oratoria TaxID=337810 RepID=UPI003F76D87A